MQFFHRVEDLQPWTGNVGKRPVRSPKVYVRDSGLVHALLGLADHDQLLGHPVAGASFEGHAVEALLASAPPRTEAHFYRTAAGAEIDLLLILPRGRMWAIEVKRGSTPKLERGFHIACADLRPTDRFAVYPGEERYALGDGVEAIGLWALAQELRSAA